LGPAVNFGLDRMASVLSFYELDRFIDLMAKKSPEEYQAWLKRTSRRSHDEHGKTQYRTVAIYD